MTKKVGNTIIIEPEPPQMCHYCGDYKETRPYGPEGEEVCFDCAINSTPEMREAAENAFNTLLS